MLEITSMEIFCAAKKFWVSFLCFSEVCWPTTLFGSDTMSALK